MIKIVAEIALYIALQSCMFVYCMHDPLSIPIPQLEPIHCLAFLDNTTLAVGTGSECLTINKIGTKECNITPFDGSHAPSNFIISHDRTKLVIKRKNDFILYDLNTKAKLSQLIAPYVHYALAISADNVVFICHENKLRNIQSSEHLILTDQATGSCIACHPHEKIISYIDRNNRIINMNYRGEPVSFYQPSPPPINTKAFYAKKNHIDSIFYSPDGNALACITQENHTFVYDITKKRTSHYGIRQCSTFFNASVIVLLDHKGSISFIDYKKEKNNQDITNTNYLESYPILSSPSSKKKVDLSPNKFLFALCIDGKCHIKHTPIAILKSFFIARYFLLKQCSEKYELPFDITNLITFILVWPHL